MQRSEQLSIGQAARVAGLSPERLRQLCNAGVVPHTRTPLGRLLDRGAVEQLAERRQAAQRGRDDR